MVAAGAIALLSLVLFPAAPAEEPATVRPDRSAPLAGTSPPLPRRYQWGFETTDPSGREVFAMAEVPMFLDGRPTQPDWVQEFGVRADRERRDRFPREPGAGFTREDPHSGSRSL